MKATAAVTLAIAVLGARLSAAAPGMLSPGGTAAREIAHLTGPVLLVFAGISIVMWILIGWVALRRTGSFADHVPWNAHGEGGAIWIAVGGVAVPVLVLGAILAVSLVQLSSFSMDGAHMHQPALRIVGHQWWWEVHYLADGADVVSANEVHVPVGRAVDLELESRDVIHSFWVPALHGKMDLIPGVVNALRIDAEARGVYQGQCAEYCGPEHGLMRLVVQADDEPTYERWLAHEATPAVVPSDPDAAAGARVFLTHQCALCHTVRGSAAAGLVGPDLTHFGERLGVAANAFPNDIASLSAWVTHAQSLKPYAQMPNITALSGDEVREVVAYLRQLQ